jgi:SAM-dependent methyltransferase
VIALDREPVLLAALHERAGRERLPVDAVEADARDFELDRRFALIIAPMQTVQLLGGREGRRAFLRRAHDHLEPGGVLAAAVAVALDGFDAGDGPALPLPDVREQDSWVYSSQPVALRTEGDVTVMERLRQVVSPDGTLAESRDEVRLDRLDATQLAAEAAGEGFEPLPARHIAPTPDHAGSDVALMRA